MVINFYARAKHPIKTTVLNLVTQLPGFSEFANQPERKIKSIGSSHDRTRTWFCIFLTSHS